MLSTLKPISVAVNKMQGNRCFIADAVEILKERSEILKREICSDKVKLQVLKKVLDPFYLQIIFLQIFSILGTRVKLQKNCRRREVGYDMDVQQSSLHNANYNKLQRKPCSVSSWSATAKSETAKRKVLFIQSWCTSVARSQDQARKKS
ncbi:uncharacterized protein ACDP82_004200 [Pangshura tecta]